EEFVHLLSKFWPPPSATGRATSAPGFAPRGTRLVGRARARAGIGQTSTHPAPARNTPYPWSRHPHSASLPPARAGRSAPPAPDPPYSCRCGHTRSNTDRRALAPGAARHGPAGGGGEPRCLESGPGNGGSGRGEERYPTRGGRAPPLAGARHAPELLAGP